MAKKINYDLDFLSEDMPEEENEKKSEDKKDEKTYGVNAHELHLENAKEVKFEDDPRTNFRIAPVCGNCKHFFYFRHKERRGFCRLPDPEKKTPGVANGDPDEVLKNWYRAHVTGTCDNHIYRGQVTSIDIVGKWVGLDFHESGIQKPKDE